MEKADGNKADYDKYIDELNQMMQVIGQAVYSQQQPSSEATGPQPEAPQAEEAKASNDKKETAEEGEVVS